jgi:hypothetical protein
VTRQRRPFAAVAVAGMLVVSCSSAPSQRSTSNVSSANDSDSAHEQGLKFAACMRAKGVKDFPDPDTSGELTIDAIANGSSVDTSGAQVQQALTACKALEPSGFTGRKRTPGQQAGALNFAQCMRDNGVKDFPDPTTDSPLIDTNRIPSTGTQRGMSLLHAAMQKCGDFAAKAGVRGP